jgi:dienelactone hydrolase
MMGRSRLRSAFITLAALAALAGLIVHSWLAGWWVERVEPRILSSLLASGLEVFAPEGEGPFPAIVQFHGCGGVFENQREWARSFRDAGWLAVVVDSHTPRGLLWRDVCRGRALLGGERAGDVAVAMADVRALPNVDPERIVLAGWSHGSWSIMDLLAMDPPNELPHNLLRMPEGGLGGLAGLVFVYPYCGFGTRADVWARSVPSLFLMAGADEVAPPEQCSQVAQELRYAGHDVTLETFEGATHAFDEAHASGDLVYDPALTRRAIGRAITFLERFRR